MQFFDKNESRFIVGKILADAPFLFTPAMESQTPCAAAGSQPVSVPVADGVSTSDAAIMKSSDCYQRNAVAASAVMDERVDDGKKMETQDTREQGKPCVSLAATPPLGDVAASAAASSELGYPPDQPLSALSGVPTAVLVKEKPSRNSTIVAPYTGLRTVSRCGVSQPIPPGFIDRNYLLCEMHLIGCSMSSLPDELGRLRTLRVLTLCTCTALTCLPNTIGGLGALQTLRLIKCSALTALPDSIGELKALQHLGLRYCSVLTMLPDAICDLVTLREILMSSCRRLTRLPRAFGNLKLLQHLELGSSGVTELPDSIGGCSALTRLQLFNCQALTALPESIGDLQKLQFLSVGGCGRLGELPSALGRLPLLGEICTTDRLRYRIPGYVHDPEGTVVLHTDQQQNMMLRNYLLSLRPMLALVLAVRRTKKMKRMLPELCEWLWREFVEPELL